MGINDANQNLSLGKLRRATDPANISSNTTADSTLRGNAAGVSSGNNFKISEFVYDQFLSEGWVSGLNQYIANVPYAKVYRGFESLSLRHFLVSKNHYA